MQNPSGSASGRDGQELPYYTLQDYVKQYCALGLVSNEADLLCEPDLLGKSYLHWLHNSPIGCKFARLLARKERDADGELEVGRIFHVQVFYDALKEPNLGAMANHILDGRMEKSELALLIFPEVDSTESLTRLIRSLVNNERWYISNDVTAPPAAESCTVGLRWILPSGRRVTHVIGFAPFESMPVTRRGPLVALGIRTSEIHRIPPLPTDRRPPRRLEDGRLQVHLADMRVFLRDDEQGRAQFCRYWDKTKEFKHLVLADAEYDSSKAKTTFILPAQCENELPTRTNVNLIDLVTYTIGYEGRTAEDVLDALTATQIDTLVDVRLRAKSRKEGMSKTRLSEMCAKQAIDYMHWPELGTPKEMMDRVKEARASGGTGYTTSETQAYREHLLTEKAPVLDQLADRIVGKMVCLLCYEADPSDCHRSVIAEELSKRLGSQIEHL